VIGLDTNVVLRLFDRTDPIQTSMVERLVADGGCLVNPIVLTEFVWTLDRAYRLDRRVIADHLDRILQASEFIVPFIDEATTAVDRYRDGPADFTDYFLSEVNRRLGCTTTVTFDRDAGKNANFTLLTD
jgi:predicted nucleic-acid-binding protein